MRVSFAGILHAFPQVWIADPRVRLPPEGYTGHPTDRILFLQDNNGDGRADAPKLFADSFNHTMSIAVRLLGNEKEELTTIQTVDIEGRIPLKTAVMPERLEDRMTVQEFRDLVEFLKSLK